MLHFGVDVAVVLLKSHNLGHAGLQGPAQLLDGGLSIVLVRPVGEHRNCPRVLGGSWCSLIKVPSCEVCSKCKELCAKDHFTEINDSD